MNLVPIDGNRWSSRPPKRDYRLIIDWPMPMPIDAYVTVHKIFWEAGNRRLKSARCKARWHLRSSPVRIAINLLKLPYEANRKHLRSPWDLENSPNRSLPWCFSEKEAVFWSLGLIHLFHEMRTRPCHIIEMSHSNSFTKEPLWVVTHTAWWDTIRSSSGIWRLSHAREQK